jgi:phosphomannomutase
MNIKTHIFREYDIRGIVEKDLTGDTPELIGRAFGSQKASSRGLHRPA